jgi:hypothetical protein
MKKLLLSGLFFALSLSASYSHWTGSGAIADYRYGQVPTGVVLELNVNGDAVTGTVIVSNRSYTITTGTFNGSTYSLAFSAGTDKITASLTQKGATMSGTMTSASGKLMTVQLLQK